MTGTMTEIFESEGHPILGLLDGIRSEMVGDQVVLGLAEGGFDIFYACEDGTIELQHVNCPTNNANDIREVFRRLCVENGLIAATGNTEQEVGEAFFHFWPQYCHVEGEAPSTRTKQ
jgi:hypothetical protein